MLLLRFFATFCLLGGLFGPTLTMANVLGDMQTFQPNMDGLDFITVHSSRPLNPGFFAVGGHFSYARNHLQVFRDLQRQELLDYKDQLVEFDTDLSYAYSERLGLFLAIPTLLWQESDQGQPVDVEISRGVHSFRPGFKYTFSNSPEAFAFIGSVDFPNVQNSPYTGVDPRPIVNLELAKNWKRPRRVTYGANLGYRLREPTATPSDAQMFPLDDQLTFSLGRSAPLWERTGWVAEAFFSYPISKDPYDDALHAASADILLGIKHRLRKNLNIDAGFTFEPFIDSQAPDFRVFTGVVYYFKPGWFGHKPQQQEEQVVPASTIDMELAQVQETGELPNRRSKPVRLEGFSIAPERIEVFEGESVDFEVFSLNDPVEMELLRGSGIIYRNEFRYRTPLKPERARIRFTDALGVSKVAQVIVKRAPRADDTLRIKNLNFVFAKAELIESSKVEIRRIVRALKDRKVSQIIVEGHTDSIGTNRYNLELSESRAGAVKKILMEELSLKANQVIAIGFGEERPIATNKTDRGRQANRRVDLKVYYRR